MCPIHCNVRLEYIADVMESTTWYKKDVFDAIEHIKEEKGEPFSLVVADPPYGNIVDEKWDDTGTDATIHAKWMEQVVEALTCLCHPNAAMYWWGGIGRPKYRPFFRFIDNVESLTDWQMSALITWRKRRAYGVRNNYLFTREECGYFVLGDPKKPRTFNVPYVDKERGYAGYNKEYPALDSRYRRTMVWDDINEVFRNKKHVCEKPIGLAKVIVETSSNPGDRVLDLFAGCGNISTVASSLGRRCVAVDSLLGPPECTDGGERFLCIE